MAKIKSRAEFRLRTYNALIMVLLASGINAAIQADKN